MRQSHTAAVELGTTWEGEFATEPYESAWAREAIFFIRLIDGEVPAGAAASVQIAPDGIHWTDEGPRSRCRARRGRPPSRASATSAVGCA